MRPRRDRGDAYGLDDALPDVLIGCAAIMILVFAVVPRVASARRAEQVRCLDGLVAAVESSGAATCPISGARYSTGDVIACTNTRNHGTLAGTPRFVRRGATWSFELSLAGAPLEVGAEVESRTSHVRVEPARIVVDTHASPLVRYALGPAAVLMIGAISIVAIRNRPIWSRGSTGRKVALVAVVLLLNPCFLVPLIDVIRSERVVFPKGRSRVQVGPRYLGLPLGGTTELDVRGLVAVDESERRHVYAVAGRGDSRVTRELVVLGTSPEDLRALAAIASALNATTRESPASPAR